MIEVSCVSRVYDRRPEPVNALRGVSLTIGRGEFVAIRGPSGSGKSSLMNILGCLDRPTAGTYRLDGTDVAALDDRALSRLRSRKIGFVFQSFNLLPRATALENVEVPMIYSDAPFDRSRARGALEHVGLAHRASHFPSELSGGEQQRVAIARALVNDPILILADEPTGNLDAAAANSVIVLLESLHTEGKTIIIVTHDAEVAARTGRQVVIRGGCIDGTP
jgi:putative ABC transport system ATP-binding protein